MNVVLSGGAQLFNGEIVAVRSAGVFDVVYADGTIEYEVRQAYMALITGTYVHFPNEW